MDTVQPLASEVITPPPKAQHSTLALHIRDSSLLLIGRVFAQGLDFAAQVLLVRYLSRSDYGAFSYGLSIVILCRGIVLFELPNTLARFVPVYQERKQYNAIFGSIVMGLGVVIGLGVLFAAAINAGLTVFNFQPTNDPQALRLLLIFALLIPLEGLDVLLTTLFATFGGSRMIFVRQALFTPGLRIALVIGLIALQADVVFLPAGYLVIGLTGVLMYAWMFRSLLRRRGLLGEWHLRQLSFPFREIFGFAVPLLASTLVWLLMESSDALLLGHFQGTEAVASFRVVLPIARLNEGVIMTFALLYTPLAARLFARNEQTELANLYRQTAVWMTLLSFPIFALTFGFARSMTVGIYGAQYTESVAIMALLSLGYFFQTALGFNGLTLKIYKKLRYSVSIDMAAAVFNLVVNLALVPRWGPMGAAVGTAGTMIVHNLLKQYGLWRITGINLFQRQYVLSYAGFFGMALALVGVQALLPTSIWIAVPVCAVASLLVLWANRGIVQADKMFPELLQNPIIRAIVLPLTRSS